MFVLKKKNTKQEVLSALNKIVQVMAKLYDCGNLNQFNIMNVSVGVTSPIYFAQLVPYF